MDLPDSTAVVGGYVLVTSGSVLLCRIRAVALFALVNLGGAVLLEWLDRDGAVSLWCAWAALTSGAIAVHLRTIAPAQPCPA